MCWEDVFHGEAGTELASSFDTATPLPGQKVEQKLSEKAGERLTPFHVEIDQDFLLLSSLQSDPHFCMGNGRVAFQKSDSGKPANSISAGISWW